jgi:dihydropteroate synthase
VTTDLHVRGAVLPTSTRVVVMGVLNVTPDSFSDGGRFVAGDVDVDAAVTEGLALDAQGADLVDVGGESTRPGAHPVAVEDELARVVPVVARLAERGVLVSIDTRHTAVARAALDVGAALVNDVGSLAPDVGMLELVAEHGAGYVAMHLRGTPRTMQDAPTFRDVVGEVSAELLAAIERARAVGIPTTHLAVDPGIGFGKTFEHNLELLAALPQLAARGMPVVVGTSRKSFLGRLTGVDVPEERLAGSLASAVLAARDGARVLRVHDVAATVQALKVQQAIDAAARTRSGDTGARA